MNITNQRLSWGILLLALTAPANGQTKNTGFWIGTDNNVIFDDQTLRLIAPRAGMVVLRAPLKGTAPSYDFPNLVQRLKQLSPGVPFLSYAWSSRFKNSNRIEGTTLQGYDTLPDLIRNQKGDIFQANGFYFGDVTQPSYSRWLSNRLQGITQQLGTDGVALDMSIRNPDRIFRGRCDRDPQFCTGYGAGMDQVMTQVQQTLKPHLVLYNGLWNSVPEIQLADQQKLLSYTDGAAIEYFGQDPLHKQTAFQQSILPFLSILQANPSKIILVFGRGSWDYSSYEADYLWQRYLYASYLLGSTPKSLFKYQASFQTPAHEGRSGGLDLYGDSDLNLGQPSANFQVLDGVYARPFSQGLVLVAPNDGPELKYLLKEPLYTTEGQKVTGTLTLKPGTGLLLFKKAPALPAKFKEDFQGPRPAGKDWRWAQIQQQGKNRWLHLDAAPAKEVVEHDLLLDGVRQLNPSTTLTLKIRSTDPQAKLLVVVDINDPQGKATQAVIPVVLGGAGGVNQVPLAFRGTATRQGTLMPYLAVKTLAKSDGNWSTLSLSPKTINTQGYTLKRWAFVRLLGNLDLDDLALN